MCSTGARSARIMTWRKLAGRPRAPPLQDARGWTGDLRSVSTRSNGLLPAGGDPHVSCPCAHGDLVVSQQARHCRPVELLLYWLLGEASATSALISTLKKEIHMQL